MEIEILGNKDTRSGFGEGLAELGRTNPNVVALCADLTGSLKMDAFAAEFPERFYQVGIAEANMVARNADSVALFIFSNNQLKNLAFPNAK